MNKIVSCALVLCSFVLPVLMAENQVDIIIRYYNQQIYFPGDSVPIRITIQNNGSDVYRFRSSDERLYNLDFDVRSIDNIEAAPSPLFVEAETTVQKIFYRSIELLPGEEFSFIEDLSRYRVLKPGIYMVHARFFPELRRYNDQVLTSNSLTLSLREGFQRSEVAEISLEEIVREELRYASLPPDEVVSYTLESRMHSEMEKFLQYLDIERLYTDQQQRREQYLRLSAFRRMEVLKEYKRELASWEINENISLIPSEYRILHTSYGPSLGTVTVEQKYDRGTYTELKRFTYELERRDGIWFIVRYQVVNLGTEE